MNDLRLKIRAGSLMLILTALLFTGCKDIHHRPEDIIPNNKEVIDSIRNGIRNYSSKITISFTSKEHLTEELSEFAHIWMEEALKETDDPGEGDFLESQLGGYKVDYSSEKEGDIVRYKVDIGPKYYLYDVEGKEAEEKLLSILSDLKLSEMEDDADKAYAIYDYLCKNVRYDKVRKDNPYAVKRSTMYGALIEGYATCNGYAVSLYRMLREAGIDSRVITGETKGARGDKLHAWNIALIDGDYYYLDATWDAGNDEYEFFLKGSKSFTDHIPQDRFRTTEFHRSYPVSGEDYKYTVGEVK